MRGNARAKQHANWVAGNLETHQAQFSNGVDHNHLSTASPEVHQGGHESRMIAGWIAADNKNRIANIEIIEHQSCCTGAYRGLQPNPDA